MRSVLSRAALAPIRSIASAGLRHRMAVDTPETEVQTNQIDVVTYRRGPTVRALMTVAGAEALGLAAQAGVRAQWEIRAALAAEARPGTRAYVTGSTAGVPWWRLVEITADHGLTHRLTRLLTATDVDVNQ